jgi:hypothetical protein
MNKQKTDSHGALDAQYAAAAAFDEQQAMATAQIDWIDDEDDCDGDAELRKAALSRGQP